LEKQLKKESEIKKILSYGDDFSKIISHLFSLKVELPYKSDQLKKFIVELHNSNRLDFIKCCKEALIHGHDVFRISDLLKKALIDLDNIDVGILVDLLELLAEKMKGDLAAGIFNSAVEDLGQVNLKLALDIEGEIFRRHNDDIFSYLVSVYVGISKQDFELAFSKLLGLTKRENDGALIANGIRGIGCLGENIVSKKDEVVRFLNVFNSSDDPLVASNSAFATCSLLRHIGSLKSEVILLSNSEVPAVQYEIASHLSINGNLEHSWKIDCFFNLIQNVKSEHKGISNYFDSILYTNINHKDNFVLLKRVLESWIQTRTDKEMVSNRLDDTFSMSITLWAANKNFISSLLAEWLNNDDPKFHKGVSHIVDYMKLHKIVLGGLDEAYLSSLDYESSLFIIRKILGYIFDFKFSADCLISFFRVPKADKKLLSLVSSVFIEHIGYNYIVKTILYFDEINRSEFGETANEYIEAILTELNKRRKELESADPINELRPELDTLLKVENQRQKLVSKAMEDAQEGSISSLFTNVSIKEGKSWFSYMHGAYSDISKMAHFSESMELPTRDVLDEVGASMERQGFRAAKRGQK